MKKLLTLALAAVFAGLFPATAQVPNFPQTVPPNTVVGRIGVTPGPTQSIPISRLGGFFSPSTSFLAAGAKCDGATDDTAAMNTALAQGGSWTVPAGKTCSVTTLNIARAGTHIGGAGKFSSVLSSSASNGAVISIAANTTGVVIEGLQITRSVLPGGSAYGIAYAGYVDINTINDNYISNHNIGVSLSSTGYGTFSNNIIVGNTSNGVQLTNTVAVGGMQWVLLNNLSQQNGGSGFAVITQHGPPADTISLGDWRGNATFANTSYGVAFLGASNAKIAGVRIFGGFFGQDGQGEVYLDTYGSQHVINGAFMELAGTIPTGPTVSTPASGVGYGIQITANNTDALVENVMSTGHSQSGLTTSASVNTSIIGGQFINNTQFGAVIADGTKASLNGAYFVNNTSGNLSVTANASSFPAFGNKPDTVNHKQIISSNTSFFVNTTGNDSHGCTNNTTDACLTIQRAYDNLVDRYTIEGASTVVTINVANGTYTSGLVTTRCVAGQNGAAAIQILGSTTPSNVVINATNNDDFGLGETAFGAGTQGCTQITIGGMQLKTTTGGNAVNVSGGGVGITLGTASFPIDFNTVAQSHIVANHSAWVIAGGNNTISGNAFIHAAALSNSVIALHNTTITCSGSPAFSVSFAQADTSGSLFVEGITFTSCGTATGTRYIARNGGIVYTLSASSTYLPGNASGTVTSKGNYVTNVASKWDLTADVTGVLPAANGGAGTITGALKANGSGVVSQAACADLSNGTASCSTDTTNAANISSGTLPAGRMPALTGDCTTSAGAVATTCTKTQGNAIALASISTSSVNFNATNTDTTVTVPAGPNSSAYIVTAVRIYNCTAAITTATWGLFTAAGGGGTTLIAATTGTVTATTAATTANLQNVGSATIWLNQGSVFFRTINPQGSAVTCTVSVTVTYL